MIEAMTLNQVSTQAGKWAMIAAVVSLCGLAGCAGKMTKSDCEQKDLYKMGLEDGQDGKDNSSFQKYAASCQPMGVNVTAEKYDYGHQVGMTSYCSNSRAESDANAGKTDSICVTQKVPPYLTAYDAQLARLKKRRESDLKQNEKDQAKLQQQNDKLKSGLNKIDEQQKATP